MKWSIGIDGGHQPLSMSFTNTTSELLVSTTNRKLMLINLFRGSAIKQMDLDDDVTVMKQSRIICCGTADGRVVMRDPRSLKVENYILAHSGTITDLDIAGNIVITCGFSSRGGALAPDGMIKMFDIRTMRALAPIPFPSGPTFLRFHPRLTSTVVGASPNGQFQFCNAVNTSEATFYQAQVSGVLSALDFSSSGELLAFADSAGVVSLWSEKNEARVNFNSRLTEFADQPPPPSEIKITDDSPLSLIGMPYYSTRLLSAWPEKLTFEVGQSAPKVPAEVLANVKTIDFVGYASNPRTSRRNQNLASARKARKEVSEVPKFRSEQDREKYFGKRGAQDNQDTDDEQSKNQRASSTPKYYKRVEIKYSKFGVEDFDFGFYNKTHYGGLETDITNSYANSLLQVMFFTRPLREVVKGHIKMSCAKEYCLACELGFLFRMLEDSLGANCQATNFLRAFKTIPQASALGLFEPDQPSSATNYATLIQNFNRFILERIQFELGDDTRMLVIPRPYSTLSTTMQQIFGLQLQAISQCQCSALNARDTCPFVVDLQYPKRVVGGKTADSTFVGILQSSINRVSSTKAWCETCKKYQPTSQYRKLQRPPNVLSINACATTEEELELFRADPTFVPARLALVFDNDELSILHLDDEQLLPSSPTALVAVYELSASVVEIREEKQLPHLVSHIRTGNNGVQEWIVFNDFMVQPVSETEPRTYHKWKNPCVLQYKIIDLDMVQDFRMLPTTPHARGLREMVLLNSSSLSLCSRRKERDLKIAYRLLKPAELPNQRGYLCALDAEFVALSKDEAEIRSDGTRSVIKPSRLSLARVTVLRGDGSDEGVPFIDEYISTTEEVVDYLTEFSGIKCKGRTLFAISFNLKVGRTIDWSYLPAGDLDIALSRHPLVSLKSAYKKLRLLVDLGCVFVGHGLKKDFRIINILVPPDQVIDTVDIFFIQNRQRKLSLRFLAWCLLRLDIQSETHDSSEDARTVSFVGARSFDFP
ncbi:ubiquitin carboxyl-terminal hydrolase-domain-containing protein [Fimicolochytrium jonesii]|uniref:ubiquitin carboxyl-terminal hydrolase-domain-containing protein n=1 Tax=Fimicolochytrium jonesii TaxID=1396493 RepID=UPI0022FF367C|nr:ubiquitin carboxyl-terminal hydrolase-domain-containing protein [Fimicolochytrium jonesii]KAI8820757.1 ubiquitin carboxyl-terminal hydrolase-domain-containing protein [Fimicolochytrium jonesii]